MTHTPTPEPNITFDGFGFNNANDEYKERLATLSKTFRSERDRQTFGKYVETAVNAHAELVAALEGLKDYASLVEKDICDQDTGWYYQFKAAIQQATKALAKAKGAS